MTVCAQGDNKVRVGGATDTTQAAREAANSKPHAANHQVDTFTKATLLCGAESSFVSPHTLFCRKWQHGIIPRHHGICSVSFISAISMLLGAVTHDM